MAKFDANSAFERGRALTQPVVKLPRTVKQSLCIDKAYSNGNFKIEPMKGEAMYDQCYLFEDINYVNKDDHRKRTTLNEIMELLKSLDGGFKITIANEQRELDAFIDEIFNPVNGADYPVIEKGMGKWINQKIHEGTRDIKKTMLLTVTCRAHSLEEAESYFTTIDTTLQNTFRLLKSRIYKLSATERMSLLSRMLCAGKECMLPVHVSPDDSGWKNQILPMSIDSDIDYMVIDNKRYVSVLCGKQYQAGLDEDRVIHDLCDVLFPTYITIDMQKVSKNVIKDKLDNAHVNNERIISQERTRNYNNKQFGATTSYNLQKKKDNIEDDLDQLEENDEEGVYLGLLVMVYADSLEELTQRVDILRKKAQGTYYTLEPYNHMQLKALNTVLPIGGRQVNHMRFFYTSSAVAFQPFYAADVHDAGGTVYGLNKTTKHLLIGNRKKLPAPHGFIVGHTGGGKSFLVKETEISQTLLFTHDDVIVLDPNNEQKEFINSLKGGMYFDLTPQAEIYLNPYEVPEHVENGTDNIRNMFIADMTDYSTSFCSAIMTNILVTRIHMNYIGRAVRKMYEDYFNASSPRAKKKIYPTLTRLRELIKEQIETVEFNEDKRLIMDVVDSLEDYTTGVYDMFAHETNLSMNSRLIGFGLKNISDKLWEPCMLTIMHFLAMRIDTNQKTKQALHLVVDEAQVLCEQETTAAQLLYAIETYRKVGAIVTLIAQNLTHVLENPALRDMFSNCPFKCFLDQGGLDAANLAKIQELSPSEFRALEESTEGHGILVWRGNVYLFDARMDEKNPLYEVFDTNFHNKADKDNQVIEQEVDDISRYEMNHMTASSGMNGQSETWEDISNASADYAWIENTNRKAQ